MTVDVKMPSFDQLLVFGCITSTSDAPNPALKAASATKEQHAVEEAMVRLACRRVATSAGPLGGGFAGPAAPPESGGETGGAVVERARL